MYHSPLFFHFGLFIFVFIFGFLSTFSTFRSDIIGSDNIDWMYFLRSDQDNERKSMIGLIFFFLQIHPLNPIKIIFADNDFY